jgi:hypothetical protein
LPRLRPRVLALAPAVIAGVLVVATQLPAAGSGSATKRGPATAAVAPRAHRQSDLFTLPQHLDVSPRIGPPRVPVALTRSVETTVLRDGNRERARLASVKRASESSSAAAAAAAQPATSDVAAGQTVEASSTTLSTPTGSSAVSSDTAPASSSGVSASQPAGPSGAGAPFGPGHLG